MKLEMGNRVMPLPTDLCSVSISINKGDRRRKEDVTVSGLVLQIYTA